MKQYSAEEQQLLILLGELKLLLTNAINSLDTKTLTPETRYLTICALTVHHAAGGYYILRQQHQTYAAKFLVRPMLEVILSAGAVMQAPGFLFRKTYTEISEEKKGHPQDSATEAHFQSILTDLETFLRTQSPQHPIERKKVNVKETAELAGMLPLYEVVYRAYCRFTHGTIDAALGILDQMTDDLDSQFVTRFVLTMLEQLQKHTLATIPDLTPFRNRLGSLKS